MKPKKITAGGVTLIATLLSSLPESSASPDINPWIGKAAKWECEDCQGLRPPTAGSDSVPTARSAPEIQSQGQRRNGRDRAPVPELPWDGVGWRHCDLTVSFGHLCITYCLVVGNAWSGFFSLSKFQLIHLYKL